MITKEQLKFLAASAEFQKLLEEDEHIRELEASKYNRSTWFDLYTASGLTWSSAGYEWKEFTFSNNKSYYYHRLANITATNFPTIVELETYDL